ncbi:hypothetical protein BH23THE1_BH23THE1_24930 [soil metagenome]
MSKSLNKYLQQISIEELDEFYNRFKCKDINEIITRINTLETSIVGKKDGLKSLDSEIMFLKEDIKARRERILFLRNKKGQKLEKEEELRYVNFLKGEIDGFISEYVVEGKLMNILKQTTNNYLFPFTNMRYKIHSISSTTRRSKNMDIHGLELDLFDAKDNLVKSKDQISGGDETALGLALRIAISKLMDRIRPFKNSEKRPALINSIMLDEPLASLDKSRRRILIETLINDKSFNQIFLISHDKEEIGECNLITLSDKDGKREVKYVPLTL